MSVKRHIIKGGLGVVILAIVFMWVGSPKQLNTWENIVSSGPALPVELMIDSLGIAAPIEPVGVTDRYVMAVPGSAGSVGWYRFGTFPGDTGSAVLAGHVNWGRGQDAVFTNLYQVMIGDIVTVKNNYGASDQFIVRDIKRYPADADASEVFTSDDGKTRLNLITCDGPWNTLLGTHSSRLVVFTEKI